MTKRTELALVLYCTLFAGTVSVFSQTWTPTSAPTNNWAGVASSADGTQLVAVGGVSIYTSTNSGMAWISNTAPFQVWIAVCSSADGAKLAATVQGGGVWTNSGTTWRQTSCPSYFYQSSSIASSADGNTLVAAGYSLYMSTNRGMTWKTPIYAYEGCAISSDGTKILALTLNPYISTNSGATWGLGTNIQIELRAATMSVDGMNLFAMGDSGVWSSMNGGALWSEETNAPTSSYGSIASSADGTHLILARRQSSQALYISTNSGVTWTSANAPTNYWSAVASSADGNMLVAAVNGGGIWTWHATPTPTLSIAPTNNSLAVSWLIPSTNFVLQQSSDLSSWSDVTNIPALNLTNLQNQVSLSLSNSIGFFRLATP